MTAGIAKGSAALAMSGSVSAGVGVCAAPSRRERRAAARRLAKALKKAQNSCDAPSPEAGGSTTTPDGGSGLAKPPAASTSKPKKTATTTTGHFTPLVVTPVVDPWASSAMVNPFTDAQLAKYAALVGGLSKPPKYLVAMYKQAARHYKIPWQLLAAINYIETDYGKDLRISTAGAIGFMQFMPATWAEYGVNVGAKGKPVIGTPNAWDPRDAIFAAARYLVANGARRNLPRAVYAYNHAGWYVQEVLSVAEQIDTQGLHPGSKAHRKIAAMRTMARLINGTPYVWGGGHANWLISDGYDCSGFVSAVLHAGGYLTAPVTTQSLPDQPGIKPGPGRYVTIFDRTYLGADADHVIIDIAGRWWESGGGGLFGAARVHRIRKMNAGYLTTFNLILHPRGL